MEKNIVKLVICDYMTGHTLTKGYKLYNALIHQEEDKYIFFQSLEEAKKYINHNKHKHINIEFHVFEEDIWIFTDTSKIDELELYK